MVAVVAQVDLRILISVLFRRRGLLKITINLRSKRYFFLKISFLTFPYSRIFLSYLLLFWRMSISGLVDLKNVHISFIQRFSGFPYLLTTFSKDVRLSWPHNFFSYLASLPLYRISLLTFYYFFEGCHAELTSKNVFCISFRWFQIGVLTPKITSGRGHPLRAYSMVTTT